MQLRFILGAKRAGTNQPTDRCPASCPHYRIVAARADVAARSETADASQRPFTGSLQQPLSHTQTHKEPRMNTLATPARILVLTVFLLIADLAGKSVIAASAPAHSSPDDEAIRQKVVLSLQDAPYFYDGHVNVRMEKGAVVLHGFVFSDWDLRDAVRIATHAAEGKRVVNDLDIVEGGRR
jgi:hypothetical protein